MEKTIWNIRISGKKLSAQDKLHKLQKFKCKFRRIIDRRGLIGDHIFNADVTGLNFHTFPKKTFVLKSEAAAPGYKAWKDRLTVFACSNVTGSKKLKLVVNEKSKNLRAFKKIRDKSSLPVSYRSQKKAWMHLKSFSS